MKVLTIPLAALAILFAGCTSPVQYRYDTRSPAGQCVETCGDDAECVARCNGVVRTEEESCRDVRDVVASEQEQQVLMLDGCYESAETDVIKPIAIGVGVVALLAAGALYGAFSYARGLGPPAEF